MDLNEYIKMSYKRPNRKVLEGLGASEDLIEYLMETPWNTNWNVVGSITNPGGGGDTGEVWLVGDTGVEQAGMMTFVLSNVDATDHITELFTNAENYSVYLNGEELPYYSEQELGSGAVIKLFADVEEQSNITKFVQSGIDGGGTITAFAGYMDASTAPTSVEVSVKAK